MKLFNLETGLNCVQSGVFLTNFGHKLFLSLSVYLLNLILCEIVGKNNCQDACERAGKNC